MNKKRQNKGYPVVVVTGPTGFLGRYVVERLLQEKLNVRCMIRNKADAESFAPHPQLSFCIGDITSERSLNRAFEKAWGVINIAGLREFWSQDRNKFYVLNHQGAINVFNACLENNIEKVVQVSTPLAFGVPDQLPFDENTKAGAHPSDYAYSKYLGDQAGLALMEQRDLPLSIVYLAALIGAGDDKSTMEVRRALEKKMPALVGANTTYTYLYVRDAAEAITKTLLKKDSVGKQFLIGKERATTREYFNLIGDIANVAIPKFNIPENVLIPIAKMLEGISRFSGNRPELPLDVLKTTAAGSLLFDSSLSEKELAMSYTPLRQALEEAVEDLRKTAAA